MLGLFVLAKIRAHLNISINFYLVIEMFYSRLRYHSLLSSLDVIYIYSALLYALTYFILQIKVKAILVLSHSRNHLEKNRQGRTLTMWDHILTI